MMKLTTADITGRKDNPEMSDNERAMRAGRAKAVLDTTIRYRGDIYTRRCLVDTLLRQGWRVTIVRGERRLMNRESGVFLDSKAIGKTAMDYAEGA